MKELIKISLLVVLGLTILSSLNAQNYYNCESTSPDLIPLLIGDYRLYFQKFSEVNLNDLPERAKEDVEWMDQKQYGDFIQRIEVYNKVDRHYLNKFLQNYLIDKQLDSLVTLIDQRDFIEADDRSVRFIVCNEIDFVDSDQSSLSYDEETHDLVEQGTPEISQAFRGNYFVFDKLTKTRYLDSHNPWDLIRRVVEIHETGVLPLVSDPSSSDESELLTENLSSTSESKNSNESENRKGFGPMILLLVISLGATIFAGLSEMGS